MTSTTDARGVLDTILAETATIDWAQSWAARSVAGRTFDRILATDGLLPAVVRDTLAGGGWAADCESYQFMDKLVLWQSTDRSLRLRMHLFFPGYLDRPHNHRWSFVTRTLAGGYLHSLYGWESEVRRWAEAGRTPAALFAQEEGIGSTYFLDHTLVHSVRAEAVTVSLLLRGPSVKDDYFTVDAESGRLVWSSGAERETTAERVAKTMTGEGHARVLATLERLSLM